MKAPTLSTDQMMGGGMPDDAFAAWFVDEILRTEFADFYTDLGPETCAAFTITGRRYAAHFGIMRPDLQAQFVYLMWGIGPNFWSFPGFSRILAAKWPREEDKIDALFNVSDAEAEAAILGADDTFWTPEFIRNNILGVPFEEEVDG
ncbi:MAG: hypothetical protein ACRC6I_16865 [Paracoccaceae bacterium]